ncbi:MAG: AzlD domain-containing protein [Eubacteriales bacterium]|nr:AzlD domain-containing protein [Eubacteriales bacterium]
MSNTLHTAAVIGIIALMTWITRGIPYLLFARKDPPAWVTYLGKVLPAAIMVILVVFCLRHAPWAAPTHGAAELISVGVVVGTQLWKKNILWSIAAGTLCYMLLIRTVFPV